MCACARTGFTNLNSMRRELLAVNLRLNKVGPSKIVRKIMPGSDEEIPLLTGGKSVNFGSSKSVFGAVAYANWKEKLLHALIVISAIIHGICNAYFAALWGEAFIAFLESMLGGLQHLLGPQIFFSNFENIIEKLPEVFSRQFQQRLTTTVLYSLILGAVILVTAYIHVTYSIILARRQVQRLRKLLMYHLLRQDIAWYQQQKSSDLIGLINQSMEQVHDAIGYRLSLIICQIAHLFGAISIGFIYNWRLTVLLLILTPVILVVPVINQICFGKFATRQERAVAKSNGIVSETFTWIKTVISYNGQRMMLNKYESTVTESARFSSKKNLAAAVSLLLISILAYGLAFGAGFWYGCQLVAHEFLRQRIGILVVLIAYVGAAVILGSLMPHIAALVEAVSSIKKVSAIKKRVTATETNSDDGVKLDRPWKIRFEFVSFAYPSRPECKVLRDVSFSVSRGEHLAIVGSSGAGKSTIISLLLRFFEVTSGQVRVDEHPLRTVDVRWLRRRLGYVSQEPVLFDATVRANIAMGGGDAAPSDAAVSEAALLANATFIDDLPDGLDTRVGARGARLSRGQQQCIALARAVVANPPMLLLDEPTSSMDQENAQLVHAAIHKASQGRTSILVTHDLDAVRRADRILVMADGEVVEMGSHEHLAALEGGVYASMIKAKETFEAPEKTEEPPTPTSLLSVPLTPPAKSYHDELPAPSVTESKGDSSSGVSSYPKLIRSNKKDAWCLVIGFLGSLVAMIAKGPIFALFMSEQLYMFIASSQELLDRSIDLSLKYALVGVIHGIAIFFAILFINRFGDGLVSILRLKLFHHLLRQPIVYFDDPENSASAITSQFANDVADVRAAMDHRAIDIITVALSGLVALGISLYIDVPTALSIFAVVIPLLLLGSYVDMRQNAYRQAIGQQQLLKIGAYSTEILTNIDTVQAYCMEPIMHAKYSQLVDSKTSTRDAHIIGLAYGFVQSVIFVIFSATIKIGAFWGDVEGSEQFEVIDIIRVIMVIIFTCIHLADTFNSVAEVSRGVHCANSIFSTLSEPVEFDNMSETGVKPSHISGTIQFSNVTLKYPYREQNKILAGASLSMHSGYTVALVGPSGCGKSTVVSLIQRLYDPDSGVITLDGWDVRVLNVAFLRRVVVAVAQEPVLFDTTIEENISYGLEDATFAAVVRAAQHANIHDFIVSLPNKYDTLVGEKGAQLSGGQKQRICIARALIRNPVVLLLDNATASLDAQTEQIVQASLRQARTGRTCLLISNKMELIRSADKICLLSNGKILSSQLPVEA